ncbi:MAG: hypothetical protein ACRDDY_17025 [Clostridium sp.]|uniref:hypothetical protein n=1 Tax=Clostridium sp. TaxID=1506 RepID=UPI003EE483DF
MRVVIRHNNKIVGKTDFPIVPIVGTGIRLRNGNEYTINKIIFVESNDSTEMDYIGHIEVEVEMENNNEKEI